MAWSSEKALVAVFVANGLGLPSFLARLVERQRDLGLSDTALGLTVVAVALGALLASPATGWAVHRYGSRGATVGAALGVAGTLWLTAAASSAPALFAALAVVGAADAAMDVAMNVNGAAFEAAAGRSALHRLHAAWSVGALLAAGGAAAAAAAGVSLLAHLAVVGVGVAAVTLLGAPGLVPTDVGPAGPPAPAGALRGRRVPRAAAVVGVATVGAAVVEGAAGDWSAVQAHRLGLSEAAAPLATAAFWAGMIAGRLMGDRRTDRHGRVAVLRRGMVLCAAGLAGGAVLGAPVPFVAGLALAGAGVSVFFPLAFSAAVESAGGAGAAAVSLGARTGFLVEPVLVGAVADATDLRVSFALAGAVAAVVAGAAARIAPPPDLGDGRT